MVIIMNFRRHLTHLCLFLAFLVSFGPSRAQELLPDLVAIADQPSSYIYGWTIDTSSNPGRTLMRLSSTIGNRGPGPLEIWGGNVDEDSLSQEVNQRIYNLNGTLRDRLAGHFEYHSAHGHIHFEGFATYNLRTVTSGNGVGSIVASGGKTSFCILNLRNYWPDLYNSAQIRDGRGGGGCGTLQGLSVGYADIYNSELPGQFIDVSGVPSGSYWLEVIADPDNHILESNEANNTTRIQITFTNPLPLLPNRAPVVTNPGNRSTPRGTAVGISITATDADNNPLTYSATGLPDGLEIDPTTGFISGTVGLNAALGYSVNVIVSDGVISSSTSFTWATTSPLNGTGLRGEYFNGTGFQTPVVSRLDSTVNFNWGNGSPAAGVNVDGFSVRWTGRVLPAFSQTYTFTTTADDGARLWVNGQQIINRWRNGSSTTSGTIALVANQEASIVLEYYESTSTAKMQLSWKSASLASQVVPKNRLFPPNPNVAPVIYAPAPQAGSVGENAALDVNASDANNDTLSYSATGLPAGLTMNAATGRISGTYAAAGSFNPTLTVSDGSLSASVPMSWQVTAATSGSGLFANYFKGSDLQTAVFDRVDATVNQNWGNGSPDPRISADNFSVRWSGEILPQYTETYTFKIVADNGARLWVNSDLLIYHWDNVSGQPPAGTWSASIQMRAGVRVPIHLEYYDATGTANVSLLWSSPSQPEQVIPMSRLFPVADQFGDNFDDNSRDVMKWKIGTTLGRLNSNAGQDLLIPVTESGGRLTVTTRANQNDDHYNGYVSNVPWNLDNLGVSVEVVQAAANGADTIFALCKDPLNFLTMIVEDGALYFDHTAQGARDITSIPYSATQHRFWRIRHAGADTSAQVTFETSADGVNWVIQRGDRPRFLVAAVFPEISAGTGVPLANPGSAIFDNFRFGHTTSLPPVINQPPVASAGGPYSGIRGTAISLNGSASGDPDGAIVSFTWNFGDGTTGTGATVDHVYATAGSFTATLTVTDNESATGSASAAVTVSNPPVNQLPIARPGGPYSGVRGTAIALNGSTSNDPDGTIVSYAWNFGDGTTGTGATVSHVYATAGNFTATLTVTDNGGATGSASVQVTVTNPVNQLPVAHPGGPYSALIGQALTLNGTQSSDPDGTIVAYAWNLGNGATGTGASPAVSYAAAGSYTVTLTVTDNGGATASASTTVTVTQPATASLSDDFSDGTRDASKWNAGTVVGQYLIGAAGYDTAIPVSETTGRLQISPRTGVDGDHYGGYISAATFDFTGMAAAVEVPQAATGGADTILAVVKDSQNFAFIVVEDGMLYFDRCTAGARTVSGIPYSATLHRWWRIRHDGATNRLHFEVSSNGTAWTSQRNDAVSFAVSALRMEISAGTGTTVASTLSAQFDNFSLVRP